MGYVIVAHDAKNNGELHVFGNTTGGEFSTQTAAINGRADLWGLTGPTQYADAVVVVVEKTVHVG